MKSLKNFWMTLIGMWEITKKFVSQSDAIRTAIRKMLDMMDEIDRRHGRLEK
nr:hypothetical protein [Methanosarcina barkeri]